MLKIVLYLLYKYYIRITPNDTFDKQNTVFQQL